MPSKKFVIAGVLTAVATGALAHSGAKGVVKVRMDSMKAIAQATKGIAKADWSDADAARAVVQENARTLSEHARNMVKLFPAGSRTGMSEATEAVWERPDEFAELARRLDVSAQAIGKAAVTASARSDIAGPLGEAGATCQACHKDFRLKR